MNLSKNLTLAEATKSQVATRRGIDNTPNAEQIRNLQLVAKHVFQPLREHFDVPIGITSGFRSKQLNTAIKGAKNSEHTLGRALDLDADIYGGVTNKEIFEFIKNHLDFNQLIWEFGDNKNPDWVHVSYSEKGNKKRVLRANRVPGSSRTTYSTF